MELPALYFHHMDTLLAEAPTEATVFVADADLFSVLSLVSLTARRFQQGADRDAMEYHANAALQRTNDLISAKDFRKVSKRMLAVHELCSVLVATLKAKPEDVIEILDRTLLVTRGRLFETWIHKAIQEKLSEVQKSPKRKAAISLDLKTTPPTSEPVMKCKIIEFGSSISFSEFRDAKTKPFVIRKGASNWPATQYWNIEYLRSQLYMRFIPVELGANYRDKNWSQKVMRGDKFVDAMLDQSVGIVYLAQHDLFSQIPNLWKDLQVPECCYLDESENEIIMNAWFGPANTVSPMHTDPYSNIFSQIIGRKYVKLYSPAESQKLYPFHDALLHNTSQVDAENPDLELFPEFQNADSVEAVLEPGDLLFIPKGWWHYVRALDFQKMDPNDRLPNPFTVGSSNASLQLPDVCYSSGIGMSTSQLLRISSNSSSFHPGTSHARARFNTYPDKQPQNPGGLGFYGFNPGRSHSPEKFMSTTQFPQGNYIIPFLDESNSQCIDKSTHRIAWDSICLKKPKSTPNYEDQAVIYRQRKLQDQKNPFRTVVRASVPKPQDMRNLATIANLWDEKPPLIQPPNRKSMVSQYGKPDNIHLESDLRPTAQEYIPPTLGNTELTNPALFPANLNVDVEPQGSLPELPRRQSSKHCVQSTDTLPVGKKIMLERGLNPNPKTFNLRPANAKFFVIKCFREDHIFKSIKYNVWASTEMGNRRLNQAFRDCHPELFALDSKHVQRDHPPRHRRGSAPNPTNHNVHVSAEMTSPVDWTSKCSVFRGTEEGKLQKQNWDSVFRVRWVFVKDVPNASLKHLKVFTNENKPVTNSRDTQELSEDVGYEMLKIFGEFGCNRCILDDWNWYEEREKSQKH